MSDARPHLVAIDGQAADPSTPTGSPGAPAPAPGSGSGGMNRAAWIAAAVAFACAIGWGVESREGRALQQELTRTTEALAASQTRVAALEGQKLEIQQQVEALTERTGGLVDQMGALLAELGALGELSARDPQAEPDPATDLPAAP